MAPLPPTPKITDISCSLDDGFVPFVDGWKQEHCLIETLRDNYYATIFVKGNNITTDWLSNVVKGAYYNGGNEIEGTISDITDNGDGTYSFNFNSASAFSASDTIQFEIDGVQSAWMNMVKVE